MHLYYYGLTERSLLAPPNSVTLDEWSNTPIPPVMKNRKTQKGGLRSEGVGLRTSKGGLLRWIVCWGKRTRSVKGWAGECGGVALK